MSYPTPNFTEMHQKHKEEKVTKKQELRFLSMQVIWTLPDDKTLAEEIESMMAITYSGTAYHIETICTACEIIYQADDQIIEFEYQDCIKACADLMNCGCFPSEAECLFECNPRSEKFAAQIWHESNDRK